MSPQSIDSTSRVVPNVGRRARGARVRRLAGPELLEDRRLLTAAWQNQTHALDVTNDGIVTPADANAVIHELLIGGIRHLAPPGPGNPLTQYYDTNGDNMVSPADALRVINRLFYAPKVTISTALPFTIDLTPGVTVTATGVGARDGSAVSVDVDLNNDGKFDGPGETARTTSSLYRGAATFDINPGLGVADPGTGKFSVSLRARLIDADGVPGVSSIQKLDVDTTTSNVLQNYVSAPDPAYTYSLDSSYKGPSDAYTVYVINLTTQQWRSSADVDKPIWKNWAQIVVPAGAIGTTAILYLHGGNNVSSAPTSVDSTLASYAVATHTVAIDLPDVPSEPLTFTNDLTSTGAPYGPRSEDEIIAYSYRQFMDHIGQPGDDTWPVLLAMVNSVVKTMDMVQTFVPTVVSGAHIDDFMITGYSKRGWTTWLTAAVEGRNADGNGRVRAIIPGVFDMLNQGPELVHHYGAYGFFADDIVDYSNENIFQDITTAAGRALGKIVDPYSYLSNGRMNIPKMILVSSGDQFFVPDSAQYYFHDLPGDENYIRYIPNTGHGLDARAAQSTLSFYDAILNNRPLPKFSWTVLPDQTIRVQTVDTPTQVLLWQATNTSSRDFRQGYTSVTWSSTVLTDTGGGVYLGNTPIPTSGATGYFIELTFPSANPSNPFVFTTEIRVNTNMALHAWPFPVDTSSAAVAAAASGISMSANNPVSPAVPNANGNVAAGLIMSLPTQYVFISYALPAPSPTGTTADGESAALASTPNAPTTQTLDDQSDDADLDAAAVDLVLDDSAAESLVLADPRG